MTDQHQTEGAERSSFSLVSKYWSSSYHVRFFSKDTEDVEELSTIVFTRLGKVSGRKYKTVFSLSTRQNNVENLFQ